MFSVKASAAMQLTWRDGNGFPLRPGCRGTFQSPAPYGSCFQIRSRSHGVVAQCRCGRRPVPTPASQRQSPGSEALCHASA